MGARAYSAPWVLPGPGAAPVRDGALALDGEHVLAVGPRAQVEARFGRGEPVDGVILPALVNAHTHLELSHLAGQVVGGDGLPGWIGRFIGVRAAAGDAPSAVQRGLERALTELDRAGVAAVGDVTNTLAPLPALARAGVLGTLFHEVFGFSRERIDAALRAADRALEAAGAPPPGLAVARSPHAVYSTRPEVVQALLRAGPASIHLAEDPAERALCARREGPFAAVARQLGAEALGRLGRSAVDAVAGSLGPRSLAVHCVDLDDEDVAALAASGATVVLCPRSNRHIGGRLPELPRLLAGGVALAVGTDSLASAPSLAPLAELAALSAAYPGVPSDRLLALAWNGAAVGAPRVGRLAPGSAPGVLLAPIDGAVPGDPAAWLLARHGAEDRPFTWLARARADEAEVA